MDVRIGWAEFDALAAPFDVRVGWAEFDALGAAFNVCVGWAEFDCLPPPVVARPPTYSTAQPKKKKRHVLTIEAGKIIARFDPVSEAEEEEIVMAILLEVASYVFY